jgi:acyl-CoA thioester hydrolase
VQSQDPSAGWFEGRTHYLPVRVYYEDTDFTGLVYHANYVRYFERGRSDFLRLAGVGHRALLEREDPAVFVVTRLAVEFRKPARIDDALLIATTYDRFRGAALAISQTCIRAGEVLATGAVAAACVTLAGRPRRPPPELVRILAPFLQPAP